MLSVGLSASLSPRAPGTSLGQSGSTFGASAAAPRARVSVSAASVMVGPFGVGTMGWALLYAACGLANPADPPCSPGRARRIMRDRRLRLSPAEAGAIWFRSGKLRRRWRVVVDQLAT